MFMMSLIFREQTVQIEKTDKMIQNILSDNYKSAVKVLDAIPGIGRVSAEQILAETSTNMTRFRNQHSISNWAGVCPGNDESAGKHKSGKTPPGK